MLVMCKQVQYRATSVVILYKIYMSFMLFFMVQVLMHQLHPQPLPLLHFLHLDHLPQYSPAVCLINLLVLLLLDLHLLHLQEQCHHHHLFPLGEFLDIPDVLVPHFLLLVLPLLPEVELHPLHLLQVSLLHLHFHHHSDGNDGHQYLNVSLLHHLHQQPDHPPLQW